MARTRKKPSAATKKSTDKKDALITDKKSDDSNKADAKKVVASKKASIRTRNKQAAEAKGKPKRMRKAADSAKKPVSKAANILTQELHVLPVGEQEGFFTKSRSITPTYIRDSINELKNVTWPGRKETWKLVFAVFVFAMVMGGFIAILDYGLERVMREVIL